MANLEPFEIVSVEEAELLEPDMSDGSIALSQILRAKDKHLIGKQSSLKNFLLLGAGFVERENPSIRDLHVDAGKEMRMSSNAPASSQASLAARELRMWRQAPLELLTVRPP